MKLFVFSLIAFAFALLLPQVSSLADGRSEAAKAIVVEHCVDCHAVPGYQAKGHPALDEPSFLAMAKSPKVYNRERLRKSLRAPHYPMQKFILSDDDIEAILDFIESLRKRTI